MHSSQEISSLEISLFSVYEPILIMFNMCTINRLLRCINHLNCNRNYSNSSYSVKHNLNNVSLQFIRFNQNSSELKCWKCGIEKKGVTDLFCESCHTIQNPHEKNNYFKVFNLDVTYDVNQKNLTNSYRKMQSVLHPDKFSNKYVVLYIYYISVCLSKEIF